MMPFHDQILIRMYDHEIIGMKYTSVEKISSVINWRELQSQFRIKKKFQSIMNKLENAGYVYSHGKSGNVYSLTELGVFYVRGLNT